MIVALLSLAVVDIPLVTTLGYTAALVVRGRGDRGGHAAARAPRRSSATRIDALALPHRRDGAGRPPARLGAVGAVRHAPPAAERRSSPWSSSSRSRCPVLDLYLGQQDNGALPTSTEARRAYDGLTAGLRRRRQRPAARQRRPVAEAGEGRPGASSTRSTSRSPTRRSRPSRRPTRRSSRPRRASRPRASRPPRPSRRRRRRSSRSSTRRRSRSSSRPTTSASRPTSRRPTRASRTCATT